MVVVLIGSVEVVVVVVMKIMVVVVVAVMGIVIVVVVAVIGDWPEDEENGEKEVEGTGAILT